jgi:hypothetical protein
MEVRSILLLFILGMEQAGGSLVSLRNEDAAVISAVALLLLGNSWGIYTPIITSTIPLVLILNFRPACKTRSILSV